jgi:hypothetical protein
MRSYNPVHVPLVLRKRNLLRVDDRHMSGVEQRKRRRKRQQQWGKQWKRKRGKQREQQRRRDELRSQRPDLLHDHTALHDGQMHGRDVPVEPPEHPLLVAAWIAAK